MARLGWLALGNFDRALRSLERLDHDPARRTGQVQNGQVQNRDHPVNRDRGG
jgi:hypothetical protein